MHSLYVLLPLVSILLAARLAGSLSRRLGFPAVLGELLAGLVLGPSVLGLVHSEVLLDGVADLGVLVLMFVAGLETDLVQMRRVGKASAAGAAGGVILPFAAGFAFGELLGLGLSTSLFLGAVLTTTSVSVSVQVLGEAGALRSRVGSVILGAAVLDDVLGILVLSLVLSLTGKGENALLTLVRLLAFFPIAIVLGRLVIFPLLRRLSRGHEKEAGLALVLAVVFLYAWSAEALGGLAAITGAYIAGVLIAQTPEADWIAKGARTVGEALFVPVFFVMVGVQADLRTLGAAPVVALGLTVIAVVTKAVGAGLGARFAGLPWPEGNAVGAGMVARGEVALVMATLGLANGLLTQPIFTAVILMAVTTTVLTPLLLRFTLNSERAAAATKPANYQESLQEAP
ncbi:MAG: cation:proton antiporter [Nitrososphaerales archaeon]